MRLSELLKNINSLSVELDRDVKRLIFDSRQIKPNDLFIAVKGLNVDGRQYISDAIKQGAVAVLVDADQSSEPIRIEQQIPLIPIFQLQTKLGELGARFFDYPAKQLKMFGVTGTNGKTSCTHFLAQMLSSFKKPCGVIGTLGSGMYGALGQASLTTPDAITLQSILRDVLNQGAKAVAMEVSSHSIDQGRINGIEFDIGIFTNLTQDHLDYHGTMAAYAAVKRRFLAEWPIKHLIINADDAYGKQWINELAQDHSVYAYSIQPLKNTNAIFATDIDLHLSGMKAMIHSPWGEGELFLPLIGSFNLSNVLAVLSALCLSGVEFKNILKHLSELKSVPGRMQKLGGEQQPLIVVDYAHTPDALEKALQALKLHTQGKLICVFGCGGDRDADKRPKMAAIAEKLADQIIVTNDNPRHEDPQTIASQIIAGFAHPERITVQLDRSKAIEKSIQLAQTGDCILIAGKGAERFQQIGDTKTPFDDVEQAQSFLNRSDTCYCG